VMRETICSAVSTAPAGHSTGNGQKRALFYKIGPYKRSSYSHAGVLYYIASVGIGHFLNLN